MVALNKGRPEKDFCPKVDAPALPIPPPELCTLPVATTLATTGEPPASMVEMDIHSEVTPLATIQVNTVHLAGLSVVEGYGMLVSSAPFHARRSSR